MIKTYMGAYFLFGIAVSIIPDSSQWIYAAVIGILGGLAAGTRKTKDWYILLQHALNTGILSVSLMLLSTKWLGQDVTGVSTALGICGIVSLGGLTTVDFFVNLSKKWFKNK